MQATRARSSHREEEKDHGHDHSESHGYAMAVARVLQEFIALTINRAEFLADGRNRCPVFFGTASGLADTLVALGYLASKFLGAVLQPWLSRTICLPFRRYCRQVRWKGNNKCVLIPRTADD